ncbi:hypothetical protein GCM10009634_39730 [Saccharothrix xinjiangensis]
MQHPRAAAVALLPACAARPGFGVPQVAPQSFARRTANINHAVIQKAQVGRAQLEKQSRPDVRHDYLARILGSAVGALDPFSHNGLVRVGSQMATETVKV